MTTIANVDEFNAVKESLRLSETGEAGLSEIRLLDEEFFEDPNGPARPAIEASRTIFSQTAGFNNIFGEGITTGVPVHGLSPVRDLSDTTAVPWRMVAHLLLRTPDDTYHGTAFLITNSVLLTAGHNLFFHDIKRTPAITVYPGRNGHQGYGVFRPKAIRVAAGWLHGDADADFGIIALDQPIGQTLGRFGVRDLPPDHPNEVYVTGYPADRNPRTQCVGAGTITGTTARRISYSVETLDGQSGGPVALRDSLSAVAIHVARPSGPAQAIRITEVVKAEVTGWLQGL